jgi:hypothetical protein
MDATNPLLHVRRIPRQVEVKENARELKIYAFAACSGADRCMSVVRGFETRIGSS